MSRAQLPPAVHDLPRAGRSPAEQDSRRSPDRGAAGHATFQDFIKLPGLGKQPNRCIPLKPVGFCREHGHPVLGRSSCGTRYCPEHFRDWLEEAVVKQVARLAAYRAAAEGAGKRLLHVVASPDPEQRWSVRKFWETRSDAYDVAREAGVRGGCVYPHPYRTNDDGDRLFETAVESGDWEEDRGKWSLLRDVAGGEWEEMQRYVEAGPHYHMLAAAEDFDGDAIASSDWVAKNIRSLPRFDYRDVESYRPMAQVAYYLLTHAAVQDGRNTNTYFGEVHPNAFDPADELGAARWERIQENARLAVTTRPGPIGASDREGAEEEERECPRDGCQSEVVPIDELHEFLEDTEWLASIDETQRLQLQGLQAWAAGLTDRPPPKAARDKQEMLVWLCQQGELGADRRPGLMAQQVGLGDFGVALW